jgi:hypothetical protein
MLSPFGACPKRRDIKKRERVGRSGLLSVHRFECEDAADQTTGLTGRREAAESRPYLRVVDPLAGLYPQPLEQLQERMEAERGR